MELQEWREKIQGCTAVYKTLFESYEAEIPKEGLLAGFYQPVFKWTKPGSADLWKVFNVDNMHYPMGDACLKYGIAGVLELTEERKETDTEETYLYRQGIHDVYTAVADYIRRHAQMAQECMRDCTEKEERQRLSKIEANCRNLLVRSPQSFLEALQLFWFLYILRSPFGGCIGRLDQKLSPFYRMDLERGSWDREEALGAIVQLYEKLNRISTGDTLRNLMLSGQNEKGEDETNELTYLFLEAYEKTQDAEPHINVRIHGGTPQRLKDLCVRLLAAGKGQPTLYFDENILPAMERAGIPHEAACGYANDGCTETVYDGRGAIVFWQHEMVKTVELTVFNGQENPFIYPVEMKKNRKSAPSFVPHTGLETGFCSGELSKMQGFSDFLDAFFRQLEFQVGRWLRIIGERMEADEREGLTSPFVGATFEKALLTGKDPLRGGGFDVGNYQLLSGTISTAADCLRAVEYCVFEKRYCTLAELRDAMACDFEGWEPLRQRLLHAPKYGNDDARADELAAMISRKFLDQVNGWRSERGKKVHPGLYNIDFKIFANVTGATPDGRRFRDPIGEHCSPTPGAAKLGPTAVVRSASRLPMREGYASSVLQLSLDGSSFVMGADREGIIGRLMETSREAGIPVWNLTMYDREELLAAQREPEKHHGLIVRVWGFNARFVELDKEMQEHIIRRIC